MRVLVLTDDRVGPVMAGAALRAWELARALDAAGHDVRLVAAPGSRPPDSEGPPIGERPSWRWAEAVLTPAFSAPPRAFCGRHLLLVDGITPLPAELDAMPSTPQVQRRRRTAAARLPLVRARADAVLVAGEEQQRWWGERMRARPEVPLLQVPFGLPEEPPPGERGEIPGVPRGWAVVLWWGGVWPWLDLDTLLAARARLGSAPLSVVVPTAARPGGAAVRYSARDLADDMAAHGLERHQAVALEEWVPYAERHRVLGRADVVAVLHHPGAEAELSFRTRALDAVWAGVPLLLSEGGEVARLARAHGWGAVIPPGDDRAAAAALELLLRERTRERCRQALAACREDWGWSEVTLPLVDALPTLPAAGRRPVLLAGLAAALALGGVGSGGAG